MAHCETMEFSHILHGSLYEMAMMPLTSQQNTSIYLQTKQRSTFTRNWGFSFIYSTICCRDSSVDIAKGCGLGDRDSIAGSGKIFLFLCLRAANVIGHFKVHFTVIPVPAYRSLYNSLPFRFSY